MTFFEMNIQMIKNRDIVLYDQLQLQQEKLIDKVMSEEAKDGTSYLKVLQKGEWVAFNSTYRPVKEAESFAGKYKELPPFGRLLCLGFGNGYVAKALVQQFQNAQVLGSDTDNANRRIAFYEPDPAIFTYVMQTYDLTDILRDENVSVFVEGLNGNQLSAWCNQNVNQLNEHIFMLDALPKYKQYYGDAYSRLEHVYEDVKQQVQAYANTQNQLAQIIAKNNLYNMKHFVNAKNTKGFMDSYPAAMPYMIVSAGPSLKDSVGLLKELQGKVFMMAVDSAAKYLLEQDITPDGIMCIDPVKEIKLFDSRMRSIPFFVHTDVNAGVLDAINPETLYFIGTNLKYYEKMANERQDTLPELELGGSVATAAFSFGAALGAKTILLVGQDLAVRQDETHVTALLNRSQQANQRLMQVPGNVTDTVDTYEDFYVYLRWFEQAIAMLPQTRVVNMTAGGAEIAGAEYVSGDALQTFMEQLMQGHRMDHAKEHWNHDAEIPTRKEIPVLKENILQGLKKSQQYMVQAIALTDTIIRQIERNDYQRDLVKLNQKLDAIGNQLGQIPEFELVEHYLAAMQGDLLRDLYVEQEDKRLELLGIYNKLNSYYIELDRHVGDVEALVQSGFEEQ